MEKKPVKFARTARKHRIGRASAIHVINTVDAVEEDGGRGQMLWTWTGEDERGRELEIIAIEKPDALVVIHVMPTHYREGKS